MNTERPIDEVVRLSFTDFEELAAAARGWRLVLSKLDPEPFEGEIFQWLTDGFIISRGRFGNFLRQEGSPPPGLRTMTVHLEREMSQYWRGRRVTGDDLMIFPREGEIDTFSDPRFDIFTISFDEEAFLAQANGMGCAAVPSILKDTEVLRSVPGGMGSLRRALFEIVRNAGKGKADPGIVKRNIQAEVIRMLEGGEGNNSGSTRSVHRLRVVRAAQDYLSRHAGKPVTVRDLSRAVGVSVRSLQYAFGEHVGVGPKTYVNSMRLNAARKELRAARSGKTCVADVANHQGFWHMGQFAADYRRLFGENPSETLGSLS